MIMPDLIVRTHRRSLSLNITKNGELVVHAPKKLSVNEIFKFIIVVQVVPDVNGVLKTRSDRNHIAHSRFLLIYTYKFA